ncbi:hypothetical protein ACSBR1_033026 [Camellia fascicularis]
MEGERGKEMKRNAIKWSELAKEAVGEGGSSDRNIHEIVAKLGHSTDNLEKEPLDRNECKVFPEWWVNLP